MNYYIEYPFPILCGLRCPYCFHQMLWQHNMRYPNDTYGDKCPFTFAQYKAWRDKHLSDGTEFLMELVGGEISHPGCQQIVLDIINDADKERFQLQTNGMGTKGFYTSLVETPERKAKIDRVGFTYHRRVIANSAKMIDTFVDNVNTLKDAGLKVYVKELLILENKKEILRNKEYWENMGVEFRLQDFKGIGALYSDETVKYTAEDWALINPEYCHLGSDCRCREGYKQILIRGYDQWGGDVLGCWQDHKVIGSIIEDWYEPYQRALIDHKASRGRTLEGKGVYRTDYMRDLAISDREQYHYNNKQRRFWMLARLEQDQERLTGLIRDAEARIVQRKTAIKQQRKAIKQAKIDNKKDREIVTMARGGIQITDDHIAWAKEPEAKAAETSPVTSFVGSD